MGPMFGPAEKAPRRTGFGSIVAGEGPRLGPIAADVQHLQAPFGMHFNY
jgi:hypothetical protein